MTGFVRWRDLAGGRRGLIGGGFAVVTAIAVGVVLMGPESIEVGSGDTLTTTTERVEVPGSDDITTTVLTTTSEVPITTPPATSPAPPSTTTSLTATTSPPAAPTTVASGPAEFAATVRGTDQGPDYYALFYGTTYGGLGGFHVYAACRPGTLTVTVLDDGMVDGEPPGWPLKLRVIVDDEFTPGNYLGDPGTTVWDSKPVTDGTVITSPVQSRVRIMVSGPSHHDVRILYDCRG